MNLHEIPMSSWTKYGYANDLRLSRQVNPTVSGIVSAFPYVVVNIEEINRKHYIHQEMLYRVSYGLASKLLSFDNGVIFLELEVRNKWDKTLNAAAYEIAQCWKTKHKELENAVACKIYIINSKKYTYKRSLLHLGVHPGYDCKKGMIFSKTSTTN